MTIKFDSIKVGCRPILPIRRAAAEAIAAKATKAENKDALKKAGEEVYKTGTAAELHAFVAKGFFETPRTAREAYAKFNPDVNLDDLTSTQRAGIAKITGTLRKGKFEKLLDKLKPTTGSNAVRFHCESSAGIMTVN